MKTKNILTFISALLVSASFAGAEDAKTPSTTPNNNSTTMADKTASSKLDFIEQGGKKFIHVSTINTVEANTQFMQNVQIINNQRQALIDLDKRKKEAFTDGEKTEIDKKIKELSERLAKDNDAMSRAYGYSLTRNYMHVIVKTRVFLKLTDEEYAKAKEDEKTKPEELLVKGDDKFRLIAEIPGVEANNVFRQNVQLMQAQRERFVQMNEALKTMADGEEKKKLQEEAKKAEETLIKNNEEMTRLYGFSLARNYLMDVEESKLYAQVNEEEFLQAEAKAALGEDKDKDKDKEAKK